MNHVSGPRDGRDTQSISVLMATYAGEKADNLQAALESVYTQTLLPRECVLVVDGRIGEEQEKVIARYQASNACRLVVVRRRNQGGLARALNDGLQYCTGYLVARMDSDDICLPHRFETQARAFAEQGSLDASFSWHAEFEQDPGAITCVKRSPETHEEISQGMKWHCVLSHPTMMVRRRALNAIGGYRSCFGNLEDYDLYVRLLQAGARMETVQEALLLFRTSMAQRVRRGGLRYAVNEWAFRVWCWRSGFLTNSEFLATASLQIGFRLTPPGLKRMLYRLVRTPTEAQAMARIHSAMMQPKRLAPDGADAL
ncbi:putative glycosyltransferase [Azospirillum argentinense]|uniref:Glycosyltransferase 2-like domain-containing protein n=3 Tax=Azospirillum TaxID=191 RepID=A0A5B0KX09_9PROT|nr:putative glycosyltransferase [Azospirillum argentinense]